MAARDRREAVRLRPGDRACAQRGAREGAAGVADLPHRSLPRKRDRAEHHGVPLRQRRLRADLEPSLRRSRADDRRRGCGRRQARCVLRQSGRAARHRAEPHVPGDDARRHGTADLLRRRRRPRRKGARAARGAAARSGRGQAACGARALRGLYHGAERGSAVTHRDVRRDAALHRQLAVGRRALLSAHWEAAAAAGDRGGGAVQARPADALQPHAHRLAQLQRDRAAHPAG